MFDRLTIVFISLFSFIQILSVANAAEMESRIIPVKVTHLNENVLLGGTVIPFKEITFSAQMPGRIEFIAGNEGDAFKKDDLLITISDESLLAKRKTALAQYDQAVVSLQNARVQYNKELWSPSTKNINRMPGMGMPAMFDNMFTQKAADMMGDTDTDLQRQADLYSSNSRINQAESQVRAVRHQLEDIDTKIRDTRSIAAFDGVIISKLVEVGDTVQPGSPLLKFAKTDYLRIQTDVPSRLVPTLRVGMTVPAKLDVDSERTPVRISQIYPLADSSKHTVTIKLDLPIGTPAVPGMYAEVLIPIQNSKMKQTIMIPRTSIVHVGSLPGVLVVNKQTNRSQLNVIRLGKAFDAKYVTVLSGLDPKSRIIDHPKAGAPVGWMPGDKVEQ
ncbi:MAG: efflux RND transporter periplasmic adaptor subunit [Pseudomonadota bacterium]